tara:strand:+ start:1644 stop:1940 length:297 start_codon:yes stop_codon:yes gene_type:complete
MQFLEIIYKKKFTLFSMILFLYLAVNLLDGERGLISYYEKQKMLDQLLKDKENLTLQLNSLEQKNSLLTDVVDADYLETLYREKFMVGKIDEKIYIKQ